ncbi:hypothetical protein LJB42_000787 [Komagataella kurtzmanii]|nr:hypothetical protein LJB42_000787 [Komagataella kurtzmanii]
MSQQYSGYGQQQQQQRQNLFQVWMGDLLPSWEEDTIRQIWLSVDPSLSEKIHSIRVIKDKTPNLAKLNNNPGYCFLRFTDYDTANELITNYQGKPIPNHKDKFFKLNWASSHTQNQQQQQGYQNTQDSSNRTQENSIFVGDLAQGVTDTMLLDAFKKNYPSAFSARIMIDSQTGKTRGFGFVKFRDIQELNKALIEMQGFVLNGRPIRVSTAGRSTSNTNGGQLKQSVQQSSTAPSSSGSQSYGFGNRLVIPPLPLAPPLNPASDPNNTALSVTNIDELTEQKELWEYFQPFGKIVLFKQTSKGSAIVVYADRLGAELAVREMNGCQVGFSRIVVKWGESPVKPPENNSDYPLTKDNVQNEFQLNENFLKNRNYDLIL